MRITIDKEYFYCYLMHFCNTFDDNNCSVSSGFVRFRQVSFGFAWFRGKGLPPYWRCFYNVFYTYDELYYEDFTSATREFCYPRWTFTVKLYNFGCSYCAVTGCTQDRKEAQPASC